MARRKPGRSTPPGQRAATTAAAATTLASRAPRLPWLDVLRGSAVVAMIIYHFGYDLNHFGWLQQDLIHDWRWRLARTLILSSFLLAAGMSLALAEQHGVARRQRWLRIGRIAGAALLVTGGSWLMFPNSAIWFGVLHALAVMSLILLLRPCPAPLAGLLGLVALALGNLFAHEMFNQPALAWIGGMTRLPITEDYVPLLPWFGVCLIGYAFMKQRLQQASARTASPVGRASAPQSRSVGLKPDLLIWLGRHSLAIYLLHQPLLLGLLYPLTQWLRPGS